MSTKLDAKFDAAADRLRSFVESSKREGGVKAKLGEALEDDPEFLRKLKPSLIAARARGETPRVDRTTEVRARSTQPAEGAGPAEHPTTPKPTPKAKRSGGGPNPFVVIGAALFVGILVAKAIDWRGHAHPRY